MIIITTRTDGMQYQSAAMRVIALSPDSSQLFLRSRFNFRHAISQMQSQYLCTLPTWFNLKFVWWEHQLRCCKGRCPQVVLQFSLWYGFASDIASLQSTLKITFATATRARRHSYSKFNSKSLCISLETCAYQLADSSNTIRNESRDIHYRYATMPVKWWTA